MVRHVQMEIGSRGIDVKKDELSAELNLRRFPQQVSRLWSGNIFNKRNGRRWRLVGVELL